MPYLIKIPDDDDFFHLISLRCNLFLCVLALLLNDFSEFFGSVKQSMCIANKVVSTEPQVEYFFQ